jgi:hypothetical protein
MYSLVLIKENYLQPSSNPSSFPSSSPSDSPSKSANPSTSPSSNPSSIPSLSPSISTGKRFYVCCYTSIVLHSYVFVFHVTLSYSTVKRSLITAKFISVGKSLIESEFSPQFGSFLFNNASSFTVCESICICIPIHFAKFRPQF